MTGVSEIHSAKSFGRAVAGAMLLLFLAGCGTKLEIVRFPGVSPVIFPGPGMTEELWYSVVVKNYATTESKSAVLGINAGYNVLGGGSCSTPPYQYYFNIPPLQPDESWVRTDQAIQGLVQPGASCGCFKGPCTGTIDFVLFSSDPHAGGTFLKGKSTDLTVTWDESGHNSSIDITPH